MSRIIKLSVILSLVIAVALGAGLTPSPAMAQTGQEIDPTTGLPPTEIAARDLGPLAANAVGGNILWDTFHGINLNYSPSSRYSELATLLAGKGFNVDENSLGVLNVDLNNYDIIVVGLGSAWLTPYSAAEVSAIQNFVNGGGGLLVMADNDATPSANIQPVSRAFGTTVGLSTVSPLDLPITNLAAHPIFAGVSQMFMRAAGEIAGTAPSVELAFTSASEPVVAVAEVGKGRVVILGDINIFENDYIDAVGANNRLFAGNTFDWMLNRSLTAILECPGPGTGGDRADLRGIRFSVNQDFSVVQVPMDGGVSGTYMINAELRRSTGFVGSPDFVVANIPVIVPGTPQVTPYPPVQIDFGNVSVTGTETFTLKFVVTSTPPNGFLFFETFGIGNAPCANVEETNENNVAVPTVRGDPAGFKVLAGDVPPIQITSSYVTSAPKIDGKVGIGEWQIGNKVPFGNGFVTLVHDRVRLYVLMDVLDDSGNDAGVGDFFWLTFDVNQDGIITPNVDLNYGLAPTNGNMRYSFYLGPNVWTGPQPNTRSARAQGFGCFFADGTLSFTFFPFSVNCSSHRVWELGIDLDEINAQPGGTARMGFRVTSGSPLLTDRVPANFTSDFSNLIQVTLNPPTDLIISPSPLANLNLDVNAIELTQAIQDRQNTLPLVQNKDTVARVYADVDIFGGSQPSKLYLYGSRGGVDLPGSPLAHFDHLPATIDREQLNDTSNFDLPSTWPQGSVQFSALVRDLFGNQDSSTPFNKGFTKKEVPTYWVVPINTGTNASPNLPSNAQISSQESYTETVYPVEDIKWVRKPWQAIGPTTVNNTIDDLNQYYSTVVLAWILGVLFGGGAPFDLPDQIYGFTPSGGGISDPTWYNSGLGRVSRGFIGSSREGTMAHEINHNLDRSNNGTWGRHAPFGCGAGGPDSNWPYVNDDIQEVGFDTRLPWVNGSGTRDTVIPNNYPDYMSYCQSDDLPGNPSGQLPTKWVSPYRWQNQFNNFASVASAGLDFATIDQVLAQVEEQVYYVSGQVNVDGTGNLNPILVQPGIPVRDIRPGGFAIEVHDAITNTLLQVPFDASFVDLEGEEVDTVNFNFHLPAVRGAAFIRLLFKGQILDEIAVSKNSPVVTLVSPNGGEKWRGVQQIVWQAEDADRDKLSFALLYTPDDGKSWFPVASNVRGNAYEVDTSSLPGGEAARIRVIATDGFNNAQDDSDGTFVVLDGAPQVIITSPEGEEKFLANESILFEGEATDASDEILPEEAFAWTIDGEPFGSGRRFEAALPEGSYEVSLAVVDSSGNTGSDSIRIHVVAELVAADVAAVSKEVVDLPAQINVGEPVGLKVVEGLHNFGPWNPQGLVLTQVWETLTPPPACQASFRVTPNMLALVETFGGPLEVTFAGEVVATNPPVDTVFEAGPGVPVDIHFKVGLPVSQTVFVEESWGIRCHEVGTSTFGFHKEVMVMDEPNVGDPNLGNNRLDVSFSVEAVPLRVTIVKPVVAPERVLAGSEFDAVIQANEFGVENLAGAELTLIYDPARLTFVDAQPAGGFNTSSCSALSNVPIAGEVRLALACTDAHTGNPLSFWVVRFGANQLAPPPTAVTTELLVTEELLVDAQVPPQGIPAVGGTDTVTIFIGICGDQNGDGLVNIFDAIIDLQIIVGLIVPTEEQLLLSDVVRDGQINIFDVILLLQHIVGLTEITECGPPPPNG